MNAKEFRDNFWRYYLLLEADFLSTERYLTLHPNNGKAFSVEYIKLIDTICSEIDVVLKAYCKYLNPASTSRKLSRYATEILPVKTDFVSQIVKQRSRYRMKHHPWKDWTEAQAPQWWQNYNDIKHHRTEDDGDGLFNYMLANQETTVNALAGLFQVEMYLYRDLAQAEGKRLTVPLPLSELFTMDGWDEMHSLGGDVVMYIGHNHDLHLETEGTIYDEI